MSKPTNTVITDQRTAISGRESAALFLLDEVMGYTYAAALRAAAIIGVADHLADGPKTAEELAGPTKTVPQRLYRVLRLLATRGVFQEDANGRFEMTTAAELLRSDVPGSLRPALVMLTDETIWRSAGMVVEALRSGDSAFRQIFGTTFFDYWAQVTEPSQDFHVGMASMSEGENQFLVRCYDFPEGATAVDVGGGLGGLLLRVLQENPSMRGILYDEEHVLAKHRLGELNAEDRWELVSGNFFESCPPGDVYLLKYIVHDWDDEKSVRILRNCREAMAPGGRVLVFDPVIPPGNTPHTGKSLDLIMMSIYSGGRERREEEFGQLFAEAGLKLSRVIDTGSYISIVEAFAT